MAAGLDYKLVVVIIVGVLTSNSECVGTLRLCGRELADALSLICQGRYNAAFKPQSAQGDYRGGRYKRGIVDECCRRGCTLKTLESYCSETPTKKDTLQISKRSELSSSEIQTAGPLGRRQEQRLPLNNFIRHSKSRKLGPLVLLYSRGTEESSAQSTNLDMTLIKSKKNDPSKQVKEDKKNDEAFLNHEFVLENEPLDTSEIMAEVVESSPENTNRAKRNVKSTFTQDTVKQSFYLGRMLAQGHRS